MIMAGALLSLEGVRVGEVSRTLASDEGRDVGCADARPAVEFLFTD